MISCVLLPGLWGCATSPTTTRLHDDDLDQIALAMSASLAASDWLRDRDAKSSRMTIVVDRVENLSSDIVTRAEQWMLVARVRASLPMQMLATTKNIRVQIPASRWQMLMAEGNVEANPEASVPGIAATHLMSATLRSIRRSGTSRGGQITDLRSEIYLVTFQVVARPSREVVWADTFSFRREARGTVID